VEDSVAFFREQPSIDLIFMDIQLADGLSFDIFQQVKIDTPVIFTTAWDHYALKAFKVNSIDYLLKPIDETALTEALQKFERIEKSSLGYDTLVSLLKKEQPNYRKRFLIKAAGRLAFIPVEDAAYFFSDDGNTFIVTKKGERYLLDLTLEELEIQLQPEFFFRINRKMTVGLDSIQRIEPHLSNRLVVDLKPAFDETVFVSRQRVSEFKSWIDQ
jgi:DNA-binding LytR/AlgR family response regulator